MVEICLLILNLQTNKTPSFGFGENNGLLNAGIPTLNSLFSITQEIPSFGFGNNNGLLENMDMLNLNLYFKLCNSY